MRRWSLWLVALGLVTSTTAFAQQTNLRANKQELNRFASAAAKDYKANRDKALKLAKKNGWVVEKTFSDGSRIALQGLDATGMPIYYITYNNSRAAATVGTDQVWAGGALGLTLSGSGNAVANKLGVWDGGRVRSTHQELVGRVTQKDSPSSNDDHATHVAGTMIASGVNGLAKGMAHGNKMLQAYDFNNDVAEMASAASGLLVSNHSYGSISGWRYNSDRKGGAADPYWEWWGHPDISTNEDYKFGYYDNSSSSWDKIAYDAPYYLIVKSSGNNRGETGPGAGQPFHRRTRTGAFELVSERPASMSSNNGYDIISTYGNAKNILTVGAVNPIAEGYTQPADVQISTFSSWGPTDDGRIKPDIVGNGVNLLSSVSSSDNAYNTLSGTSMSAPNVSGSLLLLQEHYANLMNGNLMRAATLKSLVIHTADEAGSYVGPDYIYGWGLLNTGRAATVISEFKRSDNAVYKHLLEETSLAQGQTQTIDVVASGAGPLKVTIAWTDPEATPLPLTVNALNNRTPRLVNDLDVQVLHKGTTYQAWTMDPANPSAAAVPGNNILDNVEQVYIANAVPGETYTIKISHKGTLAKGPQAFSMVASGVGGAVYCTSAPTSDQGAYIESIAVNNAALSPARTAACATYTNYTENMFVMESGQSKTITIKPATCTTAASKVAKVFIDWNANGNFTDPGEQVAASGVITDNTAFIATITAPGNIATDHKVRMRVVLSETADAASVTPCGSYTKGETQDYLVQLVKPQREIATLSVVPANTAVCATTSQAVRVRIRNNGSAEQSNIPVKVTVLKNGAAYTQLTTTYKGTLRPSREGELLLTSFATEGGATYTLRAEATLAGDAVTANNLADYSFTTALPAAAPQASVFRCGNDPNYSFTASGENGTVYWYKSATDEMPIAAGNSFALPVSQVGNTMFAALNDLDMSVGFKTKAALNSGGYNQFTPDVFVTAKAPVILESARLYIGHGGKIIFTVYNKQNVKVSERVLDVNATRAIPLPGNIPNDPNDQGEVYYLGLELPEAGDYRIAINYEGDATIYRNNQAQVNYPIGVNSVFAITGNSADPGPETYYYYFYDLRVKAIGCKSERVQVQVKGATPLTQPVITRTGLKLRSSAAEGNQWYLNGTAIPGANTQEFAPTESGDYSVIVESEGCSSEHARAYTFKYKPYALGTEFVVSPNPSDTGNFTLYGELAQDDVVSYIVYDMLGNLLRKGGVDKFNGQYETQIDLQNAASGMYLVRIQKNNEVITKKIVIQR